LSHDKPTLKERKFAMWSTLAYITQILNGTLSDEEKLNEIDRLMRRWSKVDND